MSDPYKVLNIAPTASDDEVKHAYRELARKYHPDNYHDNPLADLAQEKMKEINEAYEQIQKQRKVSQNVDGHSYSSYTYADFGGRTTRDYTYTDFGSEPSMHNIRVAINRGDISQAEKLLNEAQDRGAEWNFLMGIVCSRRGWMDDAKHYLETACSMDPTNEEYRNALAMFNSSGAYRPAGYRNFGTMTYGEQNCTRLCAGLACYSATGCPIFCCI